MPPKGAGKRGAAEAFPAADAPVPLPLLTPAELKVVELQLFKGGVLTKAEFAALHTEYARFLRLHLSGFPAVPSEPVDSMWHAHILCTREYKAWCARHNGSEMLHHNPGAGSAQGYAQTLAAYATLFGGSPPAALWPPPAAAAAPASAAAAAAAAPAAKRAKKAAAAAPAPALAPAKAKDTWVCLRKPWSSDMKKCSATLYCSRECQEEHRATKPEEQRRRFKIPMPQRHCGPCC
jgi:hypothetical protein